MMDIPNKAEFALQPNSQPATPTTEAYAVWQLAFSFFNQRLYQGQLRDCVFTLNYSRPLGYFCPGSFQNRDGEMAHQIAMNPTWFEARGDIGAFSTLVHEMAHQWRHDYGPVNRKGGRGAGGYHDKVWADRMELIGLMPSHTGEPGGRRLGFRMTHYIIEGGAFDRACREFLNDGNFIDWRDARMRRDPSPATTAAAQAPAKSPTSTRYACPRCKITIRGRRGLRVSHDDCNRQFVAD
jgi:hypothetical protein